MMSAMQDGMRPILPLLVQENPVAVSPSAATVDNFSAAMTGGQTFQL